MHLNIYGHMFLYVWNNVAFHWISFFLTQVPVPVLPRLKSYTFKLKFSYHPYILMKDNYHQFGDFTFMQPTEL